MPSDVHEPAYRLTVAPRFALHAGWAERLDRSGGVTIDRTAGGASPRDGWAPLDEATLATLTDAEAERAPTLPPTHLGLVDLPARLRRAWWMQAERGPDDTSGFDAVFAEMAGFFRFKGLPLGERTRFEVAVSAPGLRSTRPAGANAAAGLGFDTRAGGSDEAPHPPLGLINLGDEQSFLTFLPLPPRTLATRLEAAGIEDAQHLPPSGLALRFLSTFPDEPVLRVRLEPGEGLWLSPFGVLHDGWTEGKRDVDVMLRIG